MRWQNLRIDAAEQRSLPGYREPAVVRHFDAPEALDTRFYEVRAKSALNRVPERSRMPFRWTINPYRGCTHACVYCLWGGTPVLMADGRTRPIEQLRPGDRIYGTHRDGPHRRYVETEVLDQWATVKRAYRVVLADGTELVSSGDHRFLTERGWKHVADAQVGQRPHLTTGDALLGTGELPSPPEETAEYRRGYLTGMVRGVGQLGTYACGGPGRGLSEVHRFRDALVDFEGLARTAAYLRAESVEVRERVFAAATPGRGELRSVHSSSRAGGERAAQLTGWPRRVSDDWCKGFLAGIFDAEGSGSGGVLCISDTDPTIVDWITFCLRGLGFDFVVERCAGRATTVRVRGGLRERLRFLHLVDPAIRRKCDVGGAALTSDADLRVVSVEPLGRALPLYDITTGTGDFVANGVVSHNCFARPTHTYLDLDAGRDFEREIVVKVNAPEVLRTELARPSWRRDHVAMGTNTDPYQWVESRYRLMPPIWEALRDSGTPCSVLTKSPLVLRDLDVLTSFAAAGVDVSASFSVPTLDEKAWRASEPRTPHPRKRLEAVGELNRAGIPTGILIAPLMPGINDDPGQVEEILEIAGEMGAVSVGGITLHLRGEVRAVFMEWLRAYRPDLVAHYEQLYARGAYAPREQRDRHSALARGGPGPRWRGAEDDPDPGRRRAARTVGHPVASGGSRSPAQRPSQESLF